MAVNGDSILAIFYNGQIIETSWINTDLRKYLSSIPYPVTRQKNKKLQLQFQGIEKWFRVSRTTVNGFISGLKLALNVVGGWTA